MEKAKKVLVTGAHPDDAYIGAAISIRRNVENSHVLTVATGVMPLRKFPVTTGGYTFQRHEEYSAQRLKEDRLAMQGLGLDLDTQYTNLQLHDLQTHLHIPKIVEAMQRIVEEKGIERIITHEVPQSHPDHEVVSFCAHYVGKRNGIEVWEYPMYGFDDEGVERNREFLSAGHDPIEIVKFTPEEVEFRKKGIEVYETQDYIRTQFAGDSETFGRIERDFKDVPEMAYLDFFYQNSPEVPTSREVREAFARFTKSGGSK